MQLDDEIHSSAMTAARSQDLEWQVMDHFNVMLPLGGAHITSTVSIRIVPKLTILGHNLLIAFCLHHGT